MKTPIVDFAARYADSDVARFHMPGHKGASFIGCERLDITEIEGADVLYGADGIIAESEENATSLFGTAHTFYSTEGSTLAIKAMLAMVSCASGGKRPLILAARNVHRAFVHACALLDLRVGWLYPERVEHLCRCSITASDVERALTEMGERPAALYLTSPDYLGQTADVKGIATVCRKHGVPLLVDNAHGAYLRFLTPSQHPMDLGATMCCDSAHKTLPVLTGGAYLHVSKDFVTSDLAAARNMLALFASTSPSYLILQSLDLCNRYLSDGYSARLQACVARLQAVREKIAALGFSAEESEPLKLVWNANRFGYTGQALAAHLRACGVECEFADDEYLVLMATPENTERDLARLVAAFAALTPREAITLPTLQAYGARAEAVCSIREATFAPRERILVADAIGRICAEAAISCPPAVPPIVSGERITPDAATLLLRYGVDTVEVVKE